MEEQANQAEPLPSEGDQQEDYLSVLSSTDNEAKFELVCSELANKNARRILKEIAYGFDTSPLLVQKTGLSLQDVLIHLDRLVKSGLIDKCTSKALTLRGRKPNKYRISHVGVLLLPEEAAMKANRREIKEYIGKKALDTLRKRLALSILLTITALWFIFDFVLEYLISLKPQSNGGGVAVPAGGNPFTPPPIPVGSSIALPTAILIIIVLSPLIFLLMNKIAKLIVR